ncbi:methylenetetrahydrofolate reductase [NAD(P)H] [Myxococcota bacterium]|nr:methylenetetrahydrofolate reductase [NAD(P)H] [Myxococcota bacterium]
MAIPELFKTGRPVISFEFFPPKTDAGYRALFETIEELKPLSPGYVSITMGAGGSTREKTVDLTIEITRKLGLTTMAHLPCTGFRPEQIGTILDQLAAGGVHDVLALRGDPPKDNPDFVIPKDGFQYANQLVAYIASRGAIARRGTDAGPGAGPGAGSFSIAAACFPEIHPQAADAATDLVNLKRKVETGAQFLISQFFFDNAKFFDFVERARAIGIRVPIVPGIMPIASVSGIRRMSTVNDIGFPEELARALDRVDGDDDATYRLGVEWATMQCRELLGRGVPGIHFYTLNRSPASREIHRNLFGG